jgi:AcrR family transcriptional regulator
MDVHRKADEHVNMTDVQAPRRALTARQSAQVERLVRAAVVEIRTTGYAGLTVRKVAARAGVVPATAYTYFASKDHLISEAFWRKLKELPTPEIDRRRGAAARVGAALKDLTDLLSAEQRLAAAVTTAMLADDPDVKHIRDQIGLFIRQRIRAAVGDNKSAVRAIELAVSGAMIQAGMGHVPYAELPSRIAEVTTLVVGVR